VTDLTLWQLTDQYLQALQILTSDDDLPPEVVRDTLDALEGSLVVKATNVAAYASMLSINADAIGTEIDRLKAMQQRAELHAQRLRDYLKDNMIRSGIAKIEATQAPFFRLAIRKNPPKVVIDYEDMIPDEFLRTRTVTEVARDEIKRAIQAGQDVPGAHLEQTERLEIK
jgi:aromatic ring-opening dioxygenase LigB subunit